MLVLTGVFKLHSVAEHGPAMVQLDAIFQIRNGVLMATLGFLEIAVGVTILCSPRSPWSLATLIWLGSSFVLYHVIRWIVGAPGLCPCLGRLVRVSPWLDRQQGVIVWAIVLYMLSGALLLLDKRYKVFRNKEFLRAFYKNARPASS